MRRTTELGTERLHLDLSKERQGREADGGKAVGGVGDWGDGLAQEFDEIDVSECYQSMKMI